MRFVIINYCRMCGLKVIKKFWIYIQKILFEKCVIKNESKENEF